MAKVKFISKPLNKNEEPIKLSIKKEKFRRSSINFKIITAISVVINIGLITYLILTT